jgi:hypothetical protein
MPASRCSRETEQAAVRSGFYAYQVRGPSAYPQQYGYPEGRLCWCWYTGFESARTHQGLTAAYRTLEIVHRDESTS